MLIQLIGPQACGKTELRKSIAPGLVNIDSWLRGGMFNHYMVGAPGYWFEELTDFKRLRKVIKAKSIEIHRKGGVSVCIPNPGVWVYLGLHQIPVDSLVWNVSKCL